MPSGNFGLKLLDGQGREGKYISHMSLVVQKGISILSVFLLTVKSVI